MNHKIEESKKIIEAALRGSTIDDSTKYITLFYELKGLKSFAPLLVAKSLESLNIRTDAKIPNLEELASLPNLSKLSLDSGVKIDSLKALEQFPNLKSLELGKIYPLLDGLRLKIEWLQIASTTLKDVYYLKNMNKLKSLELGNSVIYTCIHDETDFTGLESLEYLYILSRTLTTLKPLQKLVNLKSLWVPASRKLKSIQGVESLTQLEAFSFYRTDVKDISPISNLAVQYLSCGETKIKTLKNIHLPKLLNLSLNHTPLKKLDIPPIPLVEYLTLESSSIESIEEVGELKSLKHLNLIDTKNLNDFSPLKKLSNLKILDLQNSNVSLEALDWIIELPSLKILNIHKTKVSESKNISSVLEKARERGIEVFTDYGFSRRMGELDKRWQILSYYMNVHKGIDNPWAYLSNKGYSVD